MLSVGMVFTAPDRDRAVFLTVADIATLQQSIVAFRQRPTVAGPSLPATTFDELSACLDRAEQPDAPGRRSVALTGSQQRHLELLMAQAAIHASLPLRIRRACTACGSQRIVNPALPKQRKAGSEQVGSIVSSVQLLSEGHPILAGLTFLANAGGDRGAADGQPVCERCEGVDFSETPVTFCPGCHELRAESILLTCPGCGHAFAGPVAEGIWSSVRAAADAFALARNVASLRAVSGQFENGLYAEQLAWLVESLGPDDELICLCRCGQPAELRYVALLLTSEQLVWSRQTVLSSATSGKLAWRDVVEVQALSDVPNAPGIAIVGRDGNVLKFANFRGSGLTFGGHEVAFTPEGIRERARLLHASQRAGSAIPPGQPARPPAPPPGAGPPAPAPTLLAAAPAGLEPSTTRLVAASVPPPPPAPPPVPGPIPQPPAVRPVPAPTAQPPAAGPPTPPPAAPPPQPPAAPPPQPPAAQQPQAPAGWYADPWRVARLRWWDGARWTGHLAQ